MDLPKAIKGYRILRGITQKEIAKELGITRQAYSFYETGQRIPDIYKVYKMAQIMKVSIDELLRKAEIY